VGLFATEFQRVKDSIGSLEDHEFLLRVLRTGRKGVYDPRIVVNAEIQPNRMEREYHRRWHTGHGHFHALLRSEHIEQTRVGTLFGVPAHLYRQALGDLVGWARAKVIGEPGRAFHHEVRLRFFCGFFRTRRHEFLNTPGRERRAELWPTVSCTRSPTRSVDAAGGNWNETRSAMNIHHVISPVVHAARTVDTRLQRLCWPSVRNVLFDARTAMEYGMMAPLHRRLLTDTRVHSCL